MNTQIQTLSFDTLPVQFSSDAFLNATAIAKHFGKRPNVYLKTEQTQEYIAALAEHLSVTKKIVTDKNQLVIVKQGNSSKFEQGTWLHPKLAIHFARWLNPKFAVWCDEQIENLLNPTIQLPPASPYAISQQDERDFTVPLATYALKLSGYLAKAKGVSPAQIQQQAVEKLSCYKRIDFCRQEQSGFFRKAVEWMHEELDKLPAVDFGVSRKDLLNIFKRQCAYKRQFENWNDYQLQSWLDEKFFNNHTERYRGFPTSLESASYKQLEKLVDSMKHLLANDFKLLDLSQQQKAEFLPNLRGADGSIGQALFNYGAKTPDSSDMTWALQDMAVLRRTFDDLLVINYDDSRLNAEQMRKVKETNTILNNLSTMLMEAAAETLKH